MLDEWNDVQLYLVVQTREHGGCRDAAPSCVVELPSPLHKEDNNHTTTSSSSSLVLGRGSPCLRWALANDRRCSRTMLTFTTYVLHNNNNDNDDSAVTPVHARLRALGLQLRFCATQPVRCVRDRDASCAPTHATVADTATLRDYDNGNDDDKRRDDTSRVVWLRVGDRIVLRGGCATLHIGALCIARCAHDNTTTTTTRTSVAAVRAAVAAMQTTHDALPVVALPRWRGGGGGSAATRHATLPRALRRYVLCAAWQARQRVLRSAAAVTCVVAHVSSPSRTRCDDNNDATTAAAAATAMTPAVSCSPTSLTTLSRRRDDADMLHDAAAAVALHSYHSNNDDSGSDGDEDATDAATPTHSQQQQQQQSSQRASTMTTAVTTTSYAHTRDAASRRHTPPYTTATTRHSATRTSATTAATTAAADATLTRQQQQQHHRALVHAPATYVETYDEKLDDALSELESRSNMLGCELLLLDGNHNNNDNNDTDNDMAHCSSRAVRASAASTTTHTATSGAMHARPHTAMTLLGDVAEHMAMSSSPTTATAMPMTTRMQSLLHMPSSQIAMANVMFARGEDEVARSVHTSSSPPALRRHGMATPSSPLATTPHTVPPPPRTAPCATRDVARVAAPSSSSLSSSFAHATSGVGRDGGVLLPSTPRLGTNVAGSKRARWQAAATTTTTMTTAAVTTAAVRPPVQGDESQEVFFQH